MNGDGPPCGNGSLCRGNCLDAEPRCCPNWLDSSIGRPLLEGPNPELDIDIEGSGRGNEAIPPENPCEPGIVNGSLGFCENGELGCPKNDCPSFPGENGCLGIDPGKDDLELSPKPDLGEGGGKSLVEGCLVLLPQGEEGLCCLPNSFEPLLNPKSESNPDDP